MKICEYPILQFKIFWFSPLKFMGLNYQNKIGVDPQLSTSLSIVADGWLIPIYKTCKPSVANCFTSLDNSWHCLTRDLQHFNSFLIRPCPIVVKFSNWVLFKQGSPCVIARRQHQELIWPWGSGGKNKNNNPLDCCWLIRAQGIRAWHIGNEMMQLTPSESHLVLWSPGPDTSHSFN